MNKKSFIVWFILAIVFGTLLYFDITQPKPESKKIDVDGIAPEVTQKAGKNFTKGVLEAIKEEFPF